MNFFWRHDHERKNVGAASGCGRARQLETGGSHCGTAPGELAIPVVKRCRAHAGGDSIQPKYYDPDEGVAQPVQACLDPKELRIEWMELRGLDAAILSVYDAPLLSTLGDVDYPIVVARAINDWLSDEWLGANPRLFVTIVVATQDPIQAAAEIRRAARHLRMVQVMLPHGARLPYGHSRTEGSGTSGAPTPSGWPTSLAELRVTRSTLFLTHLTSLITEGIFVRHPERRVVGLETGVAWLPADLWRFDKNYKGLRSECPRLKELPSAYVRRFFRFGTQGAESGNALATLPRLKLD